MAYDFKKEQKQLYLPPKTPTIVTVPPINYIAVRGKGDPNEENGEYKQSIPLLYAIAYTIKMSYKGSHKIEGFFEFSVPPLEGFWWQPGVKGVDYSNKESFEWVSLLRLPDFVTRQEFSWAVETATQKKKLDLSKAEFLPYNEGLCVQCMHIGPYEDEPATIALMDRYMEENGYTLDISATRHHHEIYLSDPRRANPTKMRTVVRHPIKKAKS